MALRDGDQKNDDRKKPIDAMLEDMEDEDVDDQDTDDGANDDDADADTDEDPDAEPDDGASDDDPDADPDADAEGDDDPDDQAATGKSVKGGQDDDLADVEAFTFRAGGRTWEVEGAVKTKDGLYIPAEKMDAVITALQRGVHHDTTYAAERQHHEAELARKDIDFAEAVVESEVMLAWFNKHLATPESIEALVANYPAQKELLIAQVEAAKQKSKAAMLEKYGATLRASAAPAEQTEDDWRAEASKAIYANLDDLLSSSEFKNVFTAEDKKELEKHIGRHARTFIAQADRDYPEEGIRKGERAVHRGTMAEEIRDFAKRLGRTQQRGKVVDKAKRFNQGARRQVSGARQTAVSSRAPEKGKRGTKITNRRDWLASLQRDIASAGNQE